MRMPTDAELEAITVDEHDIEEWIGYANKVSAALNHARIPPTYDWMLVLARFAATAATVQGMPREMFVFIARGCYDTCAAVEQAPTERRIGIDVSNINWKARVNRLAAALHQAKLGRDDIGPEALFGLLHVAAKHVHAAGLPAELWYAEIESALHYAEESVIAMGKKNQA